MSSSNAAVFAGSADDNDKNHYSYAGDNDGSSNNNGDGDYDSDVDWSDNDDDDDDDDDDDYDEEEENPMKRGRTILWLCQEGQLKIARLRLEGLLMMDRNNTISLDDGDDDISLSQAKREVFQHGQDGNYPLHEILMGGVSDTNAGLLVKIILNFGAKFPLEQYKMLATQPPSHRRTPLHWATWSNAPLSVLQSLIRRYPEALVLRDKSSHGNRTPVELYHHYYCQHRTRRGEEDEEDDTVVPQNLLKLQFLQESTTTWIVQRLQTSLHLCALRYFVTAHKTPFSKQDRKVTKITPKPWFALSVIGYCYQREMIPLAKHIVSYVGKGAKVQQPTKQKLRGKKQPQPQPQPQRTKKQKKKK